MSFIHDPGKWSQGLEELASLHAQSQNVLSRCRCPRCERFGIVSGADDYYGIIYQCSCTHVFWIDNPETGERVEGVEL